MRIYIEYLSFGLAFSLLVSGHVPAGKGRAFFIFLPTMALQVIFKSYAMLLIAVVTAFLLKAWGTPLLKSLSAVLSNLILIVVFVMLCGSLLVFYDEKLFQTISYTVIISVLLAGYSLFIRWIGGKCRMEKGSGTGSVLVWITLVELTVILLLSTVMPWALAQKNGLKTMFLFYLAFSILLFLLLLTGFYLSITERKRLNLEEAGRFRQATERIIEDRHRKIIELNHYYGKLYRSLSRYISDRDMKGLAAFFNQYIRPIHEKEIMKSKSADGLKGIHSIPLYNLLRETLLEASRLPGQSVSIQVNGEIKIDRNMELDVFIILSEFIQNALDEIRTQEDGIMKIECVNDGEKTHLKVMNSLAGPVNMAAIYRTDFTTKENHTGAGLNMALERIQRHDCMEHVNYVESGFFVQHVILSNPKDI